MKKVDVKTQSASSRARYLSFIADALAIVSLLSASGVMADILSGLKLKSTAYAFPILACVVGAAAVVLLKFLMIKKLQGRYFLSFTNEDASFALDIKRELKNMGLNVNTAMDVIRPGDNVVERISEEISRSSQMIVVISGSALHSDWISKEVEIAQNTGMRIVSIVKDDSKLPPQLARFPSFTVKTQDRGSLAPMFNDLKLELTRSTDQESI